MLVSPAEFSQDDEFEPPIVRQIAGFVLALEPVNPEVQRSFGARGILDPSDREFDRGLR
jgi:hypothetical protein